MDTCSLDRNRQDSFYVPGMVSGDTAKEKTLKSSGGEATNHQAILSDEDVRVPGAQGEGTAVSLDSGRPFGGVDV